MVIHDVPQHRVMIIELSVFGYHTAQRVECLVSTDFLSEVFENLVTISGYNFTR